MPPASAPTVATTGYDAVIDGTPPAEDPDTIGFAVTGDTTIEDVVDSIVKQEGKRAAAAFFDEAADQGLAFPGLSAVDSTDQLDAIADSLTSDTPLDSDVADRIVGPGSAPVDEFAPAEQPTAVAATFTDAPSFQSDPYTSGAATTMAIGPGVKTNHATSNGYAWLMRDYLAYYTCKIGGILFCTMQDRIDFRFTINPATRTTKVDENFRRVGNRKMSRYVTVKAQAYAVSKFRGTDYDEWRTPGDAIQWVRTSSSMGGKKVKFKMTFTGLTPSGTITGSGWTNYTKPCSKKNCRWPS
ncbi:hypothetical protein [Isoptericola sp. NPDC057191]|uniref:hypothetical protein n=1 Tax=Isoptericola sp. NPDC057191 TaxID=3346041 RepID=UPI00362DC7E9